MAYLNRAYGIHCTMDTCRIEGLRPWARNIGLVVMATGTCPQSDLDFCPTLLGVNNANWLWLGYTWGKAHLPFYAHKGKVLKKKLWSSCHRWVESVHAAWGRVLALCACAQLHEGERVCPCTLCVGGKHETATGDTLPMFNMLNYILSKSTYTVYGHWGEWPN